MHMKNYKTLKSLCTLILTCIISFSIPITVAYAAGHTDHYALNALVSMGKARTNVHWWYSQEGSHYYGYRIILGANAWEDASGLDAGFTQVDAKSDAEIRVYSDDYGNTIAIFKKANNKQKRQTNVGNPTAKQNRVPYEPRQGAGPDFGPSIHEGGPSSWTTSSQ